MIFELLLKLFSSVLQAVFGILPSIPPLPDQVQVVLDWIMSVITYPIYLASYMYGDIFPFIIGMVIVLLAFEHIYHLVMWVIKKLPIGVS